MQVFLQLDESDSPLLAYFFLRVSTVIRTQNDWMNVTSICSFVHSRWKNIWEETPSGTVKLATEIKTKIFRWNTQRFESNSTCVSSTAAPLNVGRTFFVQRFLENCWTGTKVQLWCWKYLRGDDIFHLQWSFWFFNVKADSLAPLGANYGSLIQHFKSDAMLKWGNSWKISISWHHSLVLKHWRISFINDNNQYCWPSETLIFS